MPGNGRVWVGVAPEDRARCAPLFAALNAWSVDYATDGGQSAADATGEMAGRSSELATREFFLRICTPAAQQSLALSLESSAFRGLQARAHRRGQRDARVLINLILDAGYVREPIDNATLFIDATNQPRAQWLAQLGRALGVSAPVAGQMSRRSALAVGGAVALGLASATSAGVFIADARTPRPKPPPPHGAELWSAHGGTNISAQVAADGDGVYVAADDGLHAYALADGRALWTNPNVSIVTEQGLIVAAGTIYANLYNKAGIVNSLYAVDTVRGVIRWSTQAGASIEATLSVSAGIACVLCGDGYLYAFNAADGSPRWRAQTNNVGPASFLSSPAIAGGLVYVGSLDHTIYALDAQTGKPRWQHALGAGVVSSPAVANGLVYVGAGDGYVYALDAATGKPRWRYLTDDAVEGSPAVVDGAVYIGSNDGYLYALDALSGRLRWRTFAATPPIDSQTHQVSIDPLTGAIQGTFNDPPTGRPVVSAGVVCVNLGHTLAAFATRDGAQFWRLTRAPSTNAGSMSQPTIVGDAVFAGAPDYRVYAFAL